MFPMRAHSSSVASSGACSLRGFASATFLGLLLIGLLAGCGGNSGEGTSASSPPATVTQTVGSAGGTVSLPTGKVSLTIPPGALSTDTSITITAMSNAGSAGAVYQFGPSGLIFNQPVTVTLSVDSSLLPPGTNVQDLILSYVDDYLEILTDVQIDSANSTITGKATHFSSIGWGTSTAVKNQLGRVINVSDITTTVTSFRMPIGDDGAGSDLGEDLGLLDASSTWTNFNYPKRSFNMNALSNRWYVVTAFDQDRWLNNGWGEPSLPRDDDKALACSANYLPSSLYSCVGAFHPGEDWSLRGGGNLGKPIHAIADGIVLLNQSQNILNKKGVWTSTGTFGNILIIGHKLVDGQVIASVYAHMKDPSIYGVGQPVSKGVEIGRIGGTGGVDPHLHLEIAKPDGKYFKIDADGTIKIPIFLGDRLKGDLTIQEWRWPGPNSQFINDNYYEPSKFIKNFQSPPGQGTWSATKGTLTTARTYHTATRLSNGKVLVSGGRPVPFSPNSNPRASAELYDPTIGTWITTDSMNTTRSGHSATLLSNGKVLVAGGSGTSGDLALAELYDPATGRWSFTDPMITARSNHAATLLASGKVLVAGGQGGALAELYDPATGTWTATGSLRTARSLHTATLLPNGKVLVAGGCPANSGCSSHVVQAELYDPATGIWSFTGLMVTGRDVHTATLLSNGKVLVTGGYGDTAQLASAELYDPATGEWTSTRSMSISRVVHAAVLLPNGKVLVAGRYDVATAELYDPTTGTWTSTDSMTTVRHHIQHVAVLLGTGQVLVVGGTDSSGGNALASAERYQP